MGSAVGKGLVVVATETLGLSVFQVRQLMLGTVFCQAGIRLVVDNHHPDAITLQCLGL
jgi:hypothetical protein